MQLLTSALLAIVLLFGSGFACAKRVDTPAVPGSPSAATTQQQAELRLHQALGSIASLNLGVMNTTAIIGRSTTLLKKEDEVAILRFGSKVIDVRQRAVSVLESGKTWPERSGEVLQLLRALDLPAPMNTFLDRPSNDATVQIFANLVGLLKSQISIAIGEAQVK